MTDEPPLSKTRRKAQAHDLQALGAELVELTPAQLDRLELPDALGDAVRFAQTIRKHEAKRRQLQYIGRVMRDIDPAPIRAALDVLRGVGRRQSALQHWAEQWRERLLADDSALAELPEAATPSVQRTLVDLVRDARRERADGGRPHAFRELFRTLVALREPTMAPAEDLPGDRDDGAED